MAKIRFNASNGTDQLLQRSVALGGELEGGVGGEASVNGAAQPLLRGARKAFLVKPHLEFMELEDG